MISRLADLAGQVVRWTKSTRSMTEGGDQCVEVAQLEDGTRVVRDTKQESMPPERRPVLGFTPDEWMAFIGGVLLGEFTDSKWHSVPDPNEGSYAARDWTGVPTLEFRLLPDGGIAIRAKDGCVIQIDPAGTFRMVLPDEWKDPD